MSLRLISGLMIALFGAPLFAANNCPLFSSELNQSVTAESRGDKVIVHIHGLQDAVVTRDNTIRFGEVAIDRRGEMPMEGVRNGELLSTFIGTKVLSDATFAFNAKDCQFSKTDSRVFNCALKPSVDTAVLSSENINGLHFMTRGVSTQLDTITDSFGSICN